MKFIPLIACSTLFSCIIGCSHMKVACETAPDYNFAGIKTYQWVDAPEKIMEQGDIYLDVQLQKTLNNELAAKGWKQVLDPTNATVQTTYYLEIKTHKEYTDTAPSQEHDFAGGLVFDSDKKAWSYKERSPDYLEYMVEVGTLHFMIQDAETGNTVWQGTVATKIDRTQPPEKRGRLYQQIARKLFEEFPLESSQ